MLSACIESIIRLRMSNREIQNTEARGALSMYLLRRVSKAFDGELEDTTFVARVGVGVDPPHVLVREVLEELGFACAGQQVDLDYIE